jgi:hypothetical protein
MKFHIPINLDAAMRQNEATCTTDAAIHNQSTMYYFGAEDR